MKNVKPFIIMLILTLVIVVILYKNLDSKEKSYNLKNNNKFKLNFKNHTLSCKCDLDHSQQIEGFQNQQNTIENSKYTMDQIKKFDKEEITIEKDKSFKRDDSYSDKVLYRCYYDLENKSAEKYYEDRYNYPIEPLNTSIEDDLSDSPNLSADPSVPYDDILDLEKVNNSYIFAY